MGAVAILDSTSAEWDLVSAYVNKVAVIPCKRGEFKVYLELPDRVAESGEMWLTILNRTIGKLAKPHCMSGASRAFKFFNEVFDELTAYGY